MRASLVVMARSVRHGAVVLKLVIDKHSFVSEATALREFAGRGAVRLLDSSSADHALLLERVMPGDPLGAMWNAGRDEQTTRIAVDVIRSLRLASPDDTRSTGLTDIGSEALQAIRAQRAVHDVATHPIPAATLARAEGALRELHDSQVQACVLHADLHHDNILRGTRESWLAIDPKGRTGDPASEPAAFIRNPIDQLGKVPNLRSLLSRRVDQLSEHLGYDRARVRGWAAALAVVAACWQIEDQEPGLGMWLHVAQALAWHGRTSWPAT